MIIKRSKISTLLGVALLVVGTFVGVFLINSHQIFRLGAEGENAPRDIRASNISDSSLTISWLTDKETLGFVLWAESESISDNIKSFTHSITVTGLKPQTNYPYKINSDGTLFDNKGIPWQVTTGPSLGINQNSVLISGSVISATGEPVKKALVYANIGGYLSSTLTSDTGNYVFQLGSTRTQNLENYLQINENETLVEILVQAGGAEISSAQIFPQSAKPAPPMILGQTHDFRNLAPSVSGGVPSAALQLPPGSEEKSKFSVPEGQATPVSTETVTLKSLEEGEKVTSTQPEFFGDGPKGTALSITVESENPINSSVTIGQNGSWKWSPPEGLSEGAHTITITWKDITGITRSLTRTFVVQAGEVPAFEASGSAATSTPSSTPKATTTPRPSITPTASASAAPVPETGSLTPSILFSILGLGVLALSFGIWKYAQSI